MTTRKGGVHRPIPRPCILYAQLDHHCPWMGKCIGKHNMTPFVTFVSTVYVVLGYAIVATIVWFLID